MRLLLVGAFAYPHHQGSQVYFQEQAIALRAAGAEVELLTYASGIAPSGGHPDRWRALDGFRHWKAAAWTSPSSLLSGPGWGKPLANLGLAMTLYDAIASKMLRSSGYDAILTHNIEAGLVAAFVGMTRHMARIPIVYCVHTLMEHELSTYVKCLNTLDILAEPVSIRSDPARLRHTLRRVIDRSGARLDGLLARRADGWIALTRSADRVMRRSSNRPGALIPPPLPDPRHRLEKLTPLRTAHRYGLEYKDFYLYSGNLDGYQDLEFLATATRNRGRGSPRIVLASHDPAVVEIAVGSGAGFETRWVESETAMLSLLAAARASLVTRRAPGGFPIKLVNSLAVGTAPITFLEREWGLTDGVNARVVGRHRPEDALAEAIGSLDRSPELAVRLGLRARELYEANHLPPTSAGRTLDLIEEVTRSHRRTPSGNE